ncbi:hypothetical protein KY285_023308 [Solanum tuberosum]|nr:hypothetical protein KY285_023308 [Solanum tuberosum]
MLLMNPLPAVNQDYVMVINDKCQKVASSRSSIGLNSISGTGVDPLAMYSRTGGGCSAQGCKGHTKDQCYKLIVYPSDFKSKRKVSNSTGNGAYMVGNDVNNTRNDGYVNVSDGLSFNYGDQYNQILQMLKQNQRCGQKPEDTNHAHETQANTTEWKSVYDNMIDNEKVDHRCLQEDQCEKEINRNLTGNIEQDTVEEIVQGHDSMPNDPQPVMNRRSTREVHPPVWMKDFVSLNMGKHVKYPIDECVAYNHLSKPYQEFVAATSVLTEPTSFAEANKDPKWIEAMQAKISLLEK